MAVRDIRLWPDPVLCQMCEAVGFPDPELDPLIDDLFATMYAAKGRGLAAPQVGVLKRVFVVDVSWKEGTFDPRAFVNPEVIGYSETCVEMDEQCLSIPDLPMPVSRPDQIKLRWTNHDGSTDTAEFEGILARCIQHEFDHLNGRVIFHHQPETQRRELEAKYAS